jgi:hypothetical protein
MCVFRNTKLAWDPQSLLESLTGTERAQLAAGDLRIPVWHHLEDRPGKDRDFQSDSCHATDR